MGRLGAVVRRQRRVSGKCEVIQSCQLYLEFKVMNLEWFQQHSCVYPSSTGHIQRQRTGLNRVPGFAKWVRWTEMDKSILNPTRMKRLFFCLFLQRKQHPQICMKHKSAKVPSRPERIPCPTSSSQLCLTPGPHPGTCWAFWATLYLWDSSAHRTSLKMLH